MDSRARLVDVLRSRWRDELGTDMPEVIERRWLGFVRESGIDDELLINAVLLLKPEGLSNPNRALDHLAEAQLARRRGVDVSLVLRARELIEKLGRPTGVKFRRGSHAGDYVPDPLGFDTAPYEVPGAHRPSVLEIAIALAGDEAGGKPPAQHTEGE